ncbi:MAG: T9SS type A sorting domain-containing protein [Lewinellaceae bacterium]|nr:T9SS type A sorting domain-containing protein [Saprospiraceae bacterium]MCB9312795.1 T9SS type A sorting domain-containing protein [Lewinellaceae bacterium]
MKTRILILSLFTVLSGVVLAQDFSDDFESYYDGAWLAQSSTVWTTWSNKPGSTEDAKISTEQAYSGTKSVKLVSTVTTGGPTDLVLPFGQKYTDGNFNYGMQMWIASGKGAYFNFQATATIGQIWATDVFFTQDGTIRVETGGTVQLMTNYVPETWFNLEFKIDLTNNVWEVFVDGNSIGSYSNTNNSIASIDIFPLNSAGQSTFYVDDVYFEYEPFVQPTLDLSLFSLVTKNTTIAGSSQALKLTLKNLGITPINSVDVTWTDGTNEYTDNLTGLNLNSLESHSFTHSKKLLAQQGATNVTVTLTNINGAADENDKNDVRNVTVTGIVPAPDRKVVAEEGTGTWCGWCPRGAVFMDSMAHDYPEYFVPIAVHNGDPMVVSTYDAGVGSFPGFTGYPGAIVDRASVINPAALENSLFTRVVIPAKAKLLNGAEYDANTGLLTMTVSAEFLGDISGDWRLNMVVTEDGVTGTTAAYNQSNYYSGGGNGEMGGYELLPNPVPAAQMVYDHVARAILAGWGGLAGSLPGVVSMGETHIATFTWTVPAGMKTDNMHIVSMLIAPNGSINNANDFTFDEAIANGLASSNDDPIALQSLDVYPNPAGDQVTLAVQLTDAQAIQVQVFDLMGRMVATQNYGTMSGQQWLPLQTNTLSNGVYSLRIAVGDGFVTRKLVVQH